MHDFGQRAPKGDRGNTLAAARLTLMLESADNIDHVTMDPSGTITSWNIGVQHVLGHTSEEFIGKPYSEIFLKLIF